MPAIMSSEVSRQSLDSSSTPKVSTEFTNTPQRPATEATPAQEGDIRGRLDRVLQSDIGINTLLTRLKQSISAAREFSSFLRERAALEEKHSNGIHRLTRGTQDLLGRPDNRQGSFAFNYREIGLVHERMAKNSEEFSYALNGMSDELQEIAAQSERGRKQWKHTGLEAEQRAQDADSAMEKAKQRYFSLAEQYDRVRTGERQGGKFGLKTKSAAAQEESLLGKAENADADYRSRVESAQAQRHELFTSSRPQAIRELQNLILECDAAVSMQLQKFAVLNEKLLLGNGLCVSPLKTQETSGPNPQRSLREIAQAINNQRDFHDFVLSHGSKVGPTPTEIRYEKHPALNPAQYQPPPPPGTFNQPQRSDTGFGSMSGPPNHGTQMSGVVPNYPPQPGQYPGMPQSSSQQGQPHSRQANVPGGLRNSPQQGNFPGSPNTSPQHAQFPGPSHHSQHSTSANAPQLPQISGLSTAGKGNLEGGRPEPPMGRDESGQRNFSGPPQHRPNESTYDRTSGFPSSPTIKQQVAGDNHGPMGSNPGQPMGLGRGQPPTPSGPPQNGSFGQGPFQHGGRGTSMGQPSDFRSDSQDKQQASGYQTEQLGPRGPPNNANSYGSSGMAALNTPNASTVAPNTGRRTTKPNLPPLKPCFGVPLDELFRRDGTAVPTIVYQCVQAVDMYGLNTEGIYRVSGSAQHIMELQALFDHDASLVDFRNRAAFHHDIASVTTLLKHFLRDLPDPLLTSAQYNSFIQAAKIEEDIVRRDSLHAIINSLPDPNYATLRTLTLHLNRVAAQSAQNRMTTSNLAIVFGPTLMGGHGAGVSGEIQDAGWQARVIETILNNTLQIFDDDDE